MPPPGYEPFLRAICARPDDDTPRLVYADWLDDHRDPDRAEFIRCQIACTRNPHPKAPGRRRAEMLRKANSAKWKAELPTVRQTDWGGFRRGFVEAVTFKSLWLIAESFETVAGATPIQEVVICQCEPHAIIALLSCPRLTQIRRIESRAGYVSDESLVALAACPAVGGLEVLHLPGAFWTYSYDRYGQRAQIPMITDRGASALAGSPYLNRIRRLQFGTSHMTEKGVAALRERFGAGFMM